jgi:hypothetical protein
MTYVWYSREQIEIRDNLQNITLPEKLRTADNPCNVYENGEACNWSSLPLLSRLDVNEVFSNVVCLQRQLHLVTLRFSLNLKFLVA